MGGRSARERWLWTTLSAACVAILATPRGRASPSWLLWTGFLLTRRLVGAIIAWRRKPRDPQTLTEAAIQSAKQEAGVCPRCGELVLQPEFRCYHCGSLSIQMRGGIDVWMPLVFLVLLVVGILILVGSGTRGMGSHG
jgi:hypothetical protein